MVLSVDNQIGGHECRFRRGSAVVDEIFTLREIQAENDEYKNETYNTFIDFKRHYDKIKRSELAVQRH